MDGSQEIAVAADDLMVIKRADGRPRAVLLPIAIWNRLPRTAKRYLPVEFAELDGRRKLAVIPWARFRGIAEAVEDAFDHLFAEEAAESFAREKERVDRARALGIPAEVGVPLDVIKAQCDGKHPLAAWRQYRGLTQEQLAKTAGVSRSYLAHMEMRRRSGSPDTLLKLARVLGCLIEDLIPDAE